MSNTNIKLYSQVFCFPFKQGAIFFHGGGIMATCKGMHAQTWTSHNHWNKLELLHKFKNCWFKGLEGFLNLDSIVVTCENKAFVVPPYHSIHSHAKDLEEQQYWNCLSNIKELKHYKYGWYNLNKSFKIIIKQRENNSHDTNHIIACMYVLPY